MKRTVITIILLLAAVLLVWGSIYAYKQVNTMILQGETEVKTINLSSKLSARVHKINIKKGDVVKKGDVLIELDAPEIDAKAQQTDALVNLAIAQQQKINNGTRQEQD